MTPGEIQALEQIRVGDIKSAMDQIKYLIEQNNQSQLNINNIYTELDKKINLQSLYLSEVDPVTVIGTGICSASGINVTGTGTLFTKEFIVGNSIKLGSESQVIATITSDTILTTASAFLSSYTNQIFGIIKLISREVLTGNFNFGITNGEIFNGVISQGSVLQHYGRMTSPYDVINVQFAQRLFNPAMARAMNAIQRNGDTVGSETSIYTYLFQNINWTFDAQCNCYYEGIIDASNRSSFVNKGYVDDSVSTTQVAVYALWYLKNYGTNYSSYSVNGNIYYSPYSPTLLPDEISPTFNDYFDYTTSGLKAKKSGIFLIAIHADYQYNAGADIYRTQVSILKNSIEYARGRSDFDGPSGFSAVPGTTATGVVPINIGDYIVAGTIDTSNGNKYVGSNAQITFSMSIMKIGSL